MRAFQRLGAGRAFDLQPNGDVVQRGFPGKQRVRLKQVARLAIEACERRIEDFDHSRSRFQQAGGDVQQGRFSTSGRADNGNELSMLDPEPHAFDRGVDAAIGETERHCRLIKRDRRRVCDQIRLHAFSPLCIFTVCGLPLRPLQFKR